MIGKYAAVAALGTGTMGGQPRPCGRHRPLHRRPPSDRRRRWRWRCPWGRCRPWARCIGARRGIGARLVGSASTEGSAVPDRRREWSAQAIGIGAMGQEGARGSAQSMGVADHDFDAGHWIGPIPPFSVSWGSWGRRGRFRPQRCVGSLDGVLIPRVQHDASEGAPGSGIVLVDDLGCMAFQPFRGYCSWCGCLISSPLSFDYQDECFQELSLPGLPELFQPQVWVLAAPPGPK